MPAHGGSRGKPAVLVVSASPAKGDTTDVPLLPGLSQMPADSPDSFRCGLAWIALPGSVNSLTLTGP